MRRIRDRKRVSLHAFWNRTDTNARRIRRRVRGRRGEFVHGKVRVHVMYPRFFQLVDAFVSIAQPG